MEAAVSARWFGRAGPTTQGQPAASSQRCGASQDCAENATETGRWVHSLVLPQDGSDTEAQQVHGSTRVGTSTIEAAPAGQLHGLQRSTLRGKSCRHHWPIHESTATC